MSDATIITIVFALIAAIPPTIASLAALRKASITAEKTEVIDVKTDKIATETKDIHLAVNSNWSTIKGELDSANKEIVGLKELVEKANLVKANERIAGLERLLQKVLKTDVISEVEPPDVLRLAVSENEAAEIVITKEKLY